MSHNGSIKRSLPEPDGDSCCLYEAALQALTVPVAVYDDAEFLFLNEECRRILSAKDTGDSPLVHEDSFDSSKDRSNIVLNRSLSVRGVHVKMSTPKGTVHVVVDEEPVRFRDRSAIVQLIRQIDSQRIVAYTSKRATQNTRGGVDRSECIHSAAFDLVPVPVVIQNEEHIIDANHHARLVLSNGASLAGVPLSDVLHSDYVQAGRERRQVVLKQGGQYRGFTAKLVSADGRPIYIVVDGSPVTFGGARYAVLVARDVQEFPALL